MVCVNGPSPAGAQQSQQGHLRARQHANKLARICYATLRDQAPFASTRLERKINRQAFPMPA
jgi:hypothetical protein